MAQASKGRRRGAVFALRMTEAERDALLAAMERDKGPRALGPWLIWRALARSGITTSSTSSGNTSARRRSETPLKNRVILDLCGGTGAWSEPYKKAGYDVRVVTLPALDVRTFHAPSGVWGVLAAPPCTEFSLAKNGGVRDVVSGLAAVAACLRIVAEARPRFWALENPTGMLGHLLGEPRDVFQPCDFGDAWTKRTALWGNFALPARTYVKPRSRMPGKNARSRAVTPAGFARAFFAANP